MQLDRNGYYDLPPGKIASLVTYLKMTEPPSPRPVPELPGLTLRRVVAPELDWYRGLFRRIGSDWLWFGRLVMPDAEVLATIRHPLVEVYALAQDGRDEGLLELDRREPPDVELAYFGVTPAVQPTGEAAAIVDRARRLDERYELINRLGEGGMASVHRALDRLTGRVVSVKRLQNVASLTANAPTMKNVKSAALANRSR